jgi:hypothetical protein
MRSFPNEPARGRAGIMAGRSDVPEFSLKDDDGIIHAAHAAEAFYLPHF